MKDYSYMFKRLVCSGAHVTFEALLKIATIFKVCSLTGL